MLYQHERVEEEIHARRPDDGRLPAVADRAVAARRALQRLRRQVVSRRPDGSFVARRSARAPSARDGSAAAWRKLGIEPGDRVATLLWNQPEHLELYFARARRWARVIHTLNPRLHRDELSFIVNDAEDRAIVVDESLLRSSSQFATRASSST